MLKAKIWSLTAISDNNLRLRLIPDVYFSARLIYSACMYHTLKRIMTLRSADYIQLEVFNDRRSEVGRRCRTCQKNEFGSNIVVISKELHTSHVGCPDFVLIDDVESGTRDLVRHVIEAESTKNQLCPIQASRESLPKVTKHHRRAKDHGGRVGLVRAHEVLCNVSATRLKERIFLIIKKQLKQVYSFRSYNPYPTNVAAWHDTRSTNESCTNIRDDRAVQVRHDHYVKLARLRDELHRAIIAQTSTRGFVGSRGYVRVVDNHVVSNDTRALILLRHFPESVKEESIAEFHDVRLVHASDFL